MTDILPELKASRITPEEVDHYVRQAHRMRAEMVRTMAIGFAGQIRLAVQRFKTGAGKAGAGLLSTEPAADLMSKGQRT